MTVQLDENRFVVTVGDTESSVGVDEATTSVTVQESTQTVLVQESPVNVSVAVSGQTVALQDGDNTVEISTVGLQGPQGPTGPQGAGGTQGYWGTFWSNADQPAVATYTPYAIGLDVTDPDSFGVSVVSGSRITFAHEGVYSITFSVQWKNTSNQTHDVWAWFSKNGTDVVDSNSQWTVPSRHGSGDGHMIGVINLVLELNANDYVQIMWETSSTSISLEKHTSATTAPDVPSAIVTATQVMFTQVGPTGPQGPQGNTGPAVPLSNDLPQALAASASAGVGSVAARDDHVHPTTGLALLGSANAFTVGGHTITNAAGTQTTVPLRINGAQGQTADMTQWRNHTGGVIAAVDPNGGLFTGTTLYVSNKAWIFGAADYGAALNVQPPSATTQGLIVRGRASQTANLQEWQSSAGVVWSSVDSIGRFAIGGAGVGNYGSASLSVTPQSAGSLGVVVRGAVSQTADLQQWQTDTGSVRLKVESNGTLTVNTSGTQLNTSTGAGTFIPTGPTNVPLVVRGAASQSAALQQWQNSSLNNVASMDVFGQLVIARQAINSAFLGTAQLSVIPALAANVGVIVRGAASQTGNLQEWQNSAGTVLAYLSSNGTLVSPNIPAGAVPTFVQSSAPAGVSGSYTWWDTSDPDSITLWIEDGI